MKTIIRKGGKALSSCLDWMSRNPKALALFAMVTVLGAGVVFAQDIGKGAAAFDSAASAIKDYQEPVKKLMYAIAAVIALVGAFNVYHKMTNGDQDVKKTIMLTLGGCIAMVALTTALPMFFG